MAEPDLSRAALILKNAAPAEYENFVKVYETYFHTVTAAVTEAPPDQVLIMQGRARQCKAELRTFVECSIVPTPKTPAA